MYDNTGMPYKGKFEEETYQEMVKLYESGLSTIQIGKKYGVHGGSVHDVLKKRGVKFRSISESKRKYQLNHSEFQCIDSQETAYWLGFLLADGCVVGNDVVLQLKEQDKEHLQCFKDFLKCDYPLRYRKKSKSYRLDIRSAKMSQDLISQGCIPKKSLRLEFPMTIPSYYRSLIRGYFDGDGSIHSDPSGNTIVNFAGTEPFLADIQETIHEATNAKGSIRKHSKSKVYYLKYSGSFQSEAVGQYLYKDATVFLRRKYDRFLNMKKGRASHPFRKRYIFVGEI